MKKIIIIIILLITPLVTNAQLIGSGSYSDPWSGTLSGDAIWSGMIYINGDIYVDDEKLTISPGTTIIFLSESADLIITGTGQMEADGTSENIITFTADDNNNGVFGETGERWGHISFENMTGTSNSLIDNCIIEYGLKNSPFSNIESFGGGLHIDYSFVTVSNTTIRKNFARWGGGIFINKGNNPAFINCIITDNISSVSGGGLFVYQEVSSHFNNCIIANNTSSGKGGGGGIFLEKLNANVRFLNCVISSNTSTLALGNNIRFNENTPSRCSKFYNSIVWGSNNSIYYSTAPAAPANFNYCALQGNASSYTSCININGTNNAPDGPNFSDPGNLDYSISFISPCRDAGTTSDPAVSADFIGNPRIGAYDVGAYEVQYSRWTGASSDLWATSSNWDADIDPSSGTGDIIIPSGLTNYPTGSVSQDFTIGTGNQMIVETGARATFDELTNNGSFLLECDDNDMSSLIVGTYSGNDADIQLNLTGGYIGDPENQEGRWHYISSPFTSLDVGVFAPTVTLDLAQYVESRPTLSTREGWVAFDGYVYSTGISNGPTFSNLEIGQGYNYWDNLDNTFTISGTLNTGNVIVNPGFSGDLNIHGFNLFGNPFSSGLDWDEIVNSTYFTYPENTSKGLYFTRENAQCSYVAGVGTPADVTGIIPPMQGFFTRTYSSGNSITLPAAARVHENIHARYKTATVIPLVRLSITEGAVTDEMVVRFDEMALPGLDNEFDAEKLFILDNKLFIYSYLGDVKFAINGQPFPETITEIPIAVNFIEGGTHKISAIQYQGLDNYTVILKDLVTGFEANLSDSPELTFDADPGKITDRFVLKVSSSVTAIDEVTNSSGLFSIYSANNFINIRTLSDELDGKSGQVTVFDLTGRVISELPESEFWTNSEFQIPAPAAKGVYLVEIKSGVIRYVGKVAVK